jgi:hypothetical protein
MRLDVRKPYENAALQETDVIASPHLTLPLTNHSESQDRMHAREGIF